MTSLSCGCSSSFDCKNHPSGSFCSDGQFCGCITSNDCLTSSYGKKCVTFDDPKGMIKQCSCETTADCPGGSTCTPFGCAI
ncbi:MAG: hypothetical protein EOO75_05805 [Myxococcales bacterium]|nr:MAG: hypothetical protein EOO75_05805 [Myxococcales bacterium]